MDDCKLSYYVVECTFAFERILNPLYSDSIISGTRNLPLLRVICKM